MVVNEIYKIPIKANIEIRGEKYWVSTGKIGIRKRSTANIPNFNNTPAKSTEPTVGASTCASGSQIWAGNIGTLTANANIIKGQIKNPVRVAGTIDKSPVNCKVPKFVYKRNNANSKNKEPTKV